VFYCPPTMTIILISTKTNTSILHYYRGVVKQFMVSVRQEGDHDIIGSESQLRTIAVEAIVSVEASKTPNKRTKQVNLPDLHLKYAHFLTVSVP
jgi:hypothetical protein